MINSASGHSDVILDAALAPRLGGASFRYQGEITPLFTGDATAAAKGCALSSRCVALPNLLLVERSDQLVDLPGGSARARSLAFPIAE
jgi:hypothetical protein